MAKSHHAKKRGLAPGTLAYVGERKQDKVRISSFRYTKDSLDEKEITDLTQLDGEGKLWLDVEGLHDTGVIKAIGERFNIHPLALEDILSPDQRPKMDDYDDTLYFVLQMLTWKNEKVETEQISLIIGQDFLLTFQERTGDVFDDVRKRLRERKTRIASLGTDYLAYALIDAIIDNYFVVIEEIGELSEKIESEVIKEPRTDTLTRIQLLKRELIRFRRAIWPLREAINAFSREQNELISDYTHTYLRDAYDHTVHVIDTIESLRDTVSGLLDIYLSNISNRMNEVMKVLTIIATIFIPLTFIAGVYGMNFHYMPELRWHYGYFMVLGFMLLIGTGLLAFFRRKGWL